MKQITLKTWYRIHKWIFLIVGIFLLIWFVSGVAVTSSVFFPEPTLVGRPVPTPPGFRQITLSPAGAIAQLDDILGQTAEVSSVSLRQIRDKQVYQINLADGNLHLIDAYSGTEFQVTQELAEQIARDSFPTETSIAQVERLDQNRLGYSYGPVPAYRFVFADERATYVYVSALTGELGPRSDRWSRVQDGLMSFHTFEIFKALTGRHRIVTGLLWLMSFGAVVGIVIGYYMALPSRWRIF